MSCEKSGVVDPIRVELAKHGCTLFINTVGFAWFGKFLACANNITTLLGARRYPVGLGEGSPDLIGYKEVIITPEMVGQKLSVFVGIECKTFTGKKRKQQEHWIKVLTAAGALCGFARNVSDAVAIVSKLGGPNEK